MRILFSLSVMFYDIIYFSHFLGCIFYVIDQSLIEMQYFGDPALYPDSNYYFIKTTINILHCHLHLSNH